MNIFFNSRINANQSLLNVLFGQQQKAASSQNTGCRGTRDTLTISASGKEKLTKSTSGRTHNTSIDSSIDLKSYIASAKKTNQELIENAGTQINAKTSEYMSTGKAFRAALTEKYSKLAAEAKTHSNPENYIHSKYFDKSSEYYETNLTDTERRIAYNYEMQMCRTGKINGVNYQDSLFRGIEVDGDSVDSDKIQFERALVNSQISNILKQAGVDTSSITKDCTFTVDPYSYEITVDGVDEETKVLMQNALNVGNNGKNLYKHIYYCSTQDGCESSQVTEESKMKYEAYHQVYSYTGYELDKLEEKNGTYYTKSGENILDLSEKEKYLLKAATDVEKFLHKATGGSVSLGDLSVENATIHGLPKTLDDLLNNPGGNLTYQDYASDIREILAYNRTQHKDIMSELNVQFFMADGTIQIKK